MTQREQEREAWLNERVQVNIYMPRRDKIKYQDAAHDARRSLAGWVREQMFKGLEVE